MNPDKRQPGPLGRFQISADERERQSLDNIQAALQGIRFGSVLVVVQDGVIVQIERHERIRPRDNVAINGSTNNS